MVTTSQKKRISELVEKRRELEAKGKLLNALIEFWEKANNEFEFENSHIIEIFCVEGEWTYANHKETVKSGDLVNEVFEKIKKFSQRDCWLLKGDEYELQQLGFHMTITEKKFEMRIR